MPYIVGSLSCLIALVLHECGAEDISGVDATTLHWNPHRPCATEDNACISDAQQRLGQMAMEVGAKLVGAVELKDASKALPGWESTGVQSDNSTVIVAPGWHIEKKGGNYMDDIQQKGYAVALVKPPQLVKGCPKLCVLMGHVPHLFPGPWHNVSHISGTKTISSVCGDAKASCFIGMGDWNAESVNTPFAQLVGGTPTLVAPHEKTCCYNDNFTYAFDHTVTNIQGARADSYKIYPPQLTKHPSRSEHKPTSVKLLLPKEDSASERTPHVQHMYKADRLDVV